MSDTKEIDVYITKYALAKGIYKTTGVRMEDIPGSNSAFKGFVKVGNEMFNPGDWAPTKEEAVEKVKDLRDKKIYFLSRQMAKLRDLKVDRIRTYPGEE